MFCTNCSEPLKPVVAIDIDGTLGEYHAHFHRFAEQYVGHELPHGFDGSCEFSDWLALDKAVYREIKLAFRQGGWKRFMPVYPGAKQLVTQLRQSEVEVWIATTRPFLRLDNIDPDTRHWLERNGIGYDGLLYGEDKYQRLAEILDHDRIVGVVDDLPEQVDAADVLGFRPIQKWGPHNAHNSARRTPGFTRLPDILEVLMDRVYEWRAKNGEPERV